MNPWRLSSKLKLFPVAMLVPSFISSTGQKRRLGLFPTGLSSRHVTASLLKNLAPIPCSPTCPTLVCPVWVNLEESPTTGRPPGKRRDRPKNSDPRQQVNSHGVSFGDDGSQSVPQEEQSIQAVAHETSDKGVISNAHGTAKNTALTCLEHGDQSHCHVGSLLWHPKCR